MTSPKNINSDKSQPETKPPTSHNISSTKKDTTNTKKPTQKKTLFKSFKKTDKQAEPQKKYEELNKKYQLLLAEYANYQKHSFKQTQELRKYEGQNLIHTLIEKVIDNFDYALDQKITEQNKEQFQKGIMMIYTNFKNVLKEEGVIAVPCKDQPFDPTLHSALDFTTDTNLPPDHVVRVVKKAYRFKDKLLRHAAVIVSKKPTSNTSTNKVSSSTNKTSSSTNEVSSSPKTINNSENKQDT